MYESFFQLRARPFLASPIADRYYPAASVEHARGTAERCIERAEGPVVILGSAGTGKSTVCQVLAQQMRDKFKVATLASARLCTRRALLQNILFELKQPYRDREEGELRLSLIDFLEPSEACPNGMLLLVDEAQVLPLRLLEEIRMLTNLVRNDQPRVRLVLAANLALEERLASPRLESFNQRIAARCYLQSMNRDETCGYVCAQLSAVGGDPEQIFAVDALHAIYRATDGIPRLVNQVCDHVLVMAAIGRHAPVDAAGVEEAWADLQQLPTPWSAGESATRESTDTGTSILEFGELDGQLPDEAAPDETLTDNPTLEEPALEEPTLEEPQPDPSTLPDEPSPEEVRLEKTLVEETVRSPEPVEPQVAARLDEIESGISAIANDGDGGSMVQEGGIEEPQFRPAGDSQPEIELVFHRAHDPFNESFEDEEVIVDPLGSLETLAGNAAAPLMHENGVPTIPFHASRQEKANEQQRFDEDEIAALLPDPVRASVADSMSDAIDAMNMLPGDDRDLLEIQDDSDDEFRQRTVAMVEPGTPRRAYRQLFANLRRR